MKRTKRTKRTKRIDRILVAMLIFVLSMSMSNIYAAEADDKVEPDVKIESDKKDIIVVLDPGHGGKDGGSSRAYNGVTYLEKNLNLAIAQYCKEELETYNNVKVYLTRTSDYYVSLDERVKIAKQLNADIFVSIHNNANYSSSYNGAEVYYANNNYSAALDTNGCTLSLRIMEQLTSLGLRNAKVASRNSADGTKYPDGSKADYYGVIRGSKRAGFSGIIVEHAHLSNLNDFANFLSTDEKLKALGVADATGIANYYGLSRGIEGVSVAYSTHVQTYGWQNWVTDGTLAGTTGEAKRLEAIRICVSGEADLEVVYKTHVQSYGWVDNSYNGSPNGTAGESKRLEAIMIDLVGVDAANYDIYYRVHAQSFGWLGWAKNGEAAGTAGYAKRLEGIQIQIVPAGERPDETCGGIASSGEIPYITTESISPSLNVSNHVRYRAHVQSIGWRNYVYAGDTAGSVGKGLRVEALNVELMNNEYEGGIRYQSHVQSIGWQDWVKDGELTGTEGQAKRVEAMRIELYGEVAAHYDVYYRAHVQSIGWQDWVSNGQLMGTEGRALRMEAVEIKLVEKN